MTTPLRFTSHLGPSFMCSTAMPGGAGNKRPATQPPDYNRVDPKRLRGLSSLINFHERGGLSTSSLNPNPLSNARRNLRLGEMQVEVSAGDKSRGEMVDCGSVLDPRMESSSLPDISDLGQMDGVMDCSNLSYDIPEVFGDDAASDPGVSVEVTPGGGDGDPAQVPKVSAEVNQVCINMTSHFRMNPDVQPFYPASSDTDLDNQQVFNFNPPDLISQMINKDDFENYAGVSCSTPFSSSSDGNLGSGSSNVILPSQQFNEPSVEHTRGGTRVPPPDNQDVQCIRVPTILCTNLRSAFPKLEHICDEIREEGVEIGFLS